MIRNVDFPMKLSYLCAMPQKRPIRTGTVRTRRGILNLLKEAGPSDSSALARRLRVSSMAVRQHLYGLRDEGLVTYEEERRPLGRPAKVWRLMPEADRFFRDDHASLAINLIENIKRVFGQKGLDRLLCQWRRQRGDSLERQMPKRGSLRKLLTALVTLRKNDGYLAEMQELDDGSFLFLENHCAIRAAASVCGGLCAVEESLLSRALGHSAKIMRTEHILKGDRRCAYRITVA